jgi:hypothetical protein
MAENVKFGDYTPVPRDRKTIDIVYRGVFFDGTGNNKFNVSTKDQKTPLYYQRKDDTSYSDKTDYTNVSRIFSCCPADYAIYIEGTGTKANEGDDKIDGLALGTGKWGVPARVTEGCQALAGSLKSLKKINTLVVDAYGFSRGAATARSFVANISSKENKNFFKNPLQQEWNHYRGALGMALKEKGIEVKNLEIRFLCIFDTVSSYNWSVATLPPNFEDDIKELRLNNLEKVQYIMHFTAEDEHREYFALTRVPKRFNVHEINLPGIHGDVGGGIASGLEVVEKIDERFSQEPLKKLMQHLIDEKWYTADQLEILPSTKFKVTIKGFEGIGIPGYWRLQGTRTIDNSFSYTPLGLISARTFRDNNLQNQAGLSKIKFMNFPPINETQIKNKYPLNKLSEELIRLMRLRFAVGIGYIPPTSLRQENGTYITLQQALKDADAGLITDKVGLLKDLRNKYLHWSSRFESVGMQPAKNRKRIELKE